MTQPPSRWQGLDRKAIAVAEFTIKQQRKRLSTWVVLLVGLGAIGLITLFYVDAMTMDYEAIDNDNDSVDWDNDGYPTGQEILWGTDPYSSASHPGLIDASVVPDAPEIWINEDDFDWDDLQSGSIGYDDDGDCLNASLTKSRKDSNRNGILCDISIREQLYSDSLLIISDPSVDEDPDDEAYAKEAIHRAFVLAIGKLGFVFLIGIFIPLFMATGLIRDEMSSGTMHFLLAKPMSRSEIYLFRMFGFLAIVWPYLVAVILLTALVTGFIGPSDGVFRTQDVGVWLAVLVASMFATFVYAMLFSLFGIMWKHGIVLALPFAAWELGMILTTLGAPDAAILRFSVIGWAMNIVDAGAAMSWTDTPIFIQMGMFGGLNQPLEGAEALDIFWSDTGLGLSHFATIALSITVMIVQSAVCWFVGSVLFKTKEIE